MPRIWRRPCRAAYPNVAVDTGMPQELPPGGAVSAGWRLSIYLVRMPNRPDVISKLVSLLPSTELDT